MTSRGQVRFQDIVKMHGDFSALKGVTFEIEPGEFFALLGPSGSGKSTTLRILAGLDAPTSGRVFIDGRDITGADARDRDIAMVFQSYALYPHMTVYENIAFPLEMAKLPATEIEPAVKDAARKVKIDHLLDRKPGQLSGGQQQRCALARAIVRKARLFLLDEPLSNLDAKLRMETRAELKKLQRSLGVTAVYVTHDQEEAMTLADRMAVFMAGEIQQVGRPADIFAKPNSVDVAAFIGSPPMNLLPARFVDGDVVIVGHRLKTAMQAAGERDVVVGIRPGALRIAVGRTQGPRRPDRGSWRHQGTRPRLRWHADADSRGRRKCPARRRHYFDHRASARHSSVRSSYEKATVRIMTARIRKKTQTMDERGAPRLLSSLPLHIKVRETIRRQVRDGELIDKTGRLMTEAELGRHFGVSRITIRNAITPLVDEGMFARARGRGTFLRSNQPENWVGKLMGFSETIRDAGYQAGATVLQQGMTNRHDAGVRDQLKERAVWQLKRLRLADDIPIAIEHAFYPPDIGLELEKRDLTSIIMYSVFEDELGHAIKEARQTIGASLADTISAKLLGVKAGCPLLSMERLTLSKDDRPLELSTLGLFAELFSSQHQSDEASRLIAPTSATFHEGPSHGKW